MKALALAAMLWVVAAQACTGVKCGDGLDCTAGSSHAGQAGQAGHAGRGIPNAGTGGASGRGGEGGAVSSSGGSGGSAGQVSAGGAGVAGSAGKGPMIECPPECFRAVNCVEVCGGPSISNGCCPCVAPAFDDIKCGPAGARQQ